jgi:hypothetical protein
METLIHWGEDVFVLNKTFGPTTRGGIDPSGAFTEIIVMPSCVERFTWTSAVLVPNQGLTKKS